MQHDTLNIQLGKDKFNLGRQKHIKRLQTYAASQAGSR
jgi:hypothetical protein